MTDSTIANQIQKFEPGALVALYVLDASNFDGGPTYYFTSTDYGGVPIEFQGQAYTPVDFEATGFEYSGKGPQPRPRIRISNVNKVAQAAAIEFSDLLGATLTRIRTYREFLDDGATPGNHTLPLDVYTVDRKSSQNSTQIEWELASALEQQGKMLPGRQIFKNFCNLRYRRWNGSSFDVSAVMPCPFSDATYFTREGVATTAANDVCNKTLSACQLRFGQHGDLPFGGFPGIGNL